MDMAKFPYGSTITLGSTGVAGSEFLARLFAIQENLYGADGQIHLDSPACQQALTELVELRQCTSPEYCGWWTQTAKRFAEGNFAMSILYLETPKLPPPSTGLFPGIME